MLTEKLCPRNVRCKMLLVLQFLVLLAVGSTVESLVCRCDDCANSETCDPGIGGRCYVQILNFPGLANNIRRRCFEAQSIHLCGHRDSQLVVQCCDTDMCNDAIVDPPQEPITTTIPSPSQTSSSSTAALTVSDRTTTITPSRTTTVLEPSPTAQQEYQCVHHHSSWPLIKTHCRTNGSCYWRIRRKTDGGVIFQQGCSTPNKPCEQSIRNREAIFCCTGNLCNDVEPPVTVTKPTPMCTTPSLSDDLVEQTVTEPEPSNTPTVMSSCAPSSPPHVITVTMTVTTTTTAEFSQTPVPTPVVPPSKVEEELCLAVTGLGVGFLFTSVISSLIACVCMRLFFHKCQRHHHPCNKPSVKI